ncbi:MAG TPA: hypothetical protein VGI99_08475 [Gemmataceae bacterium]
MAKKSKPAKAPKPAKASKPAKPKGPGEPVYSVMAFITLVALAIGCTLLYLDFDEYGKQTAPAEKVPALPKLGDGTP